MPKRAKPAPEDELIASAFNSAVHERLQMLAKVIKLNQSKIGRAVGVEPSTVNKWFQGTRLPSVYQMALFCREYGCSLDFIYRGSLGTTMRRDLALALAATYPELVLGPDHPAMVEEEVA